MFATRIKDKIKRTKNLFGRIERRNVAKIPLKPQEGEKLENAFDNLIFCRPFP